MHSQHTACLLISDFDKYMGDMEIATMMDQVKKRIAELEALGTDEEVRCQRTDLSFCNLQESP